MDDLVNYQENYLKEIEEAEVRARDFERLKKIEQEKERRLREKYAVQEKKREQKMQVKNDKFQSKFLTQYDAAIQSSAMPAER